METAILILAVSFFLFLYYMFNRAMKASANSFHEIQNTLGQMKKKLDVLEEILNSRYTPYKG